MRQKEIPKKSKVKTVAEIKLANGEKNKNYETFKKLSLFGTEIFFRKREWLNKMLVQNFNFINKVFLVLLSISNKKV
jgi:hypothetical protein